MSATDSADRTSIAPAGRWSVDAAQSRVAFAVRHMLLTTVRGHFKEFHGTLTVAPSGSAEACGSVGAASIDTNQPERDEHLRDSTELLDVAHHPEISFTSTGITQLGERRFRVLGELTMRGVTRELELDARSHDVTQDPDGRRRIRLELQGELNRTQFGLVWHEALDTGGVLVGEKVKIALEISAVQVERS